MDYLAPAGVPSPNPVTVMATSQADNTRTASASVTILPHIIVGVFRASITLSSGGHNDSRPAVTGTDNQQVTWNVTGAGCGASGACGSIDSSGLYTAPQTAPSPNLINVVATSSEDTTQSATATVTISGGPNISSLAPSSAYAGFGGGLHARIVGSNFAALEPGTRLDDSGCEAPRTTSCVSSTECTTSLSAADLLSAGNLSVQAQNPDGTISNTASFVVLAPGSTGATIPLTPGAPSVTGKDIVVVELSTNGGSDASGSVGLDVAAIGAYSVFSNSCALADSPVIIVRPPSGVGTADLCLFSVSGLDPSFTYTLSGPAVPDITSAIEKPLGFGILHLTLQVPATSAPGPRTLFVQNPAMDMAAGTGAHGGALMKKPLRNRLQAVAAVFVFSLLSVLSALRATTLARVSLDQLAAASDDVARVRCAGAESRWENGAIWTVTTFDVIESMKGNLPPQVVVRLPGGKVGQLTAAVDGTPKFVPGDEAVLFLQRTRAGRIFGGGLGGGNIPHRSGSANRRETVTQDSSGFAVFDAATRTFRSEGIRQMPMEEFRARVAAAIARAQEKTR